MQNLMVMFTFSVIRKTLFLSKFGPKNQKRQFKIEFSTYTNLNKQNSILAKFGSKNQNCQLKMKFGT